MGGGEGSGNRDQRLGLDAAGEVEGGCGGEQRVWVRGSRRGSGFKEVAGMVRVVCGVGVGVFGDLRPCV